MTAAVNLNATSGRADLGPGDGSRRGQSRLSTVQTVLEQKAKLTVDELATMLGVSAATVRRDLARLERQRVVIRSHGGAVWVGRDFETPVASRAHSHTAEKRRIAARAAGLVGKGAVVGITGGTTTMEVARAISAREELTVVTNALNIGAELAVRQNVRLVLTGGVARTASFELSGPIAERTIRDYNLDIAFVGVDGVDPTAGFTTHNDLEATTDGALVARATRVVVVADSTKIGRVKFARICDLERVDLFITDTGATEEQVIALREAGLEVDLA